MQKIITPTVIIKTSTGVGKVGGPQGLGGLSKGGARKELGGLSQGGARKELGGLDAIDGLD